MYVHIYTALQCMHYYRFLPNFSFQLIMTPSPINIVYYTNIVVGMLCKSSHYSSCVSFKCD